MPYRYKDFIIRPSSTKYKKYDVYHVRNPSSRLLSFGDRRFFQFFDRIGHYIELNHYDEERRQRYYKRHNKDHGLYSPDWFSKVFLW